MNEIQLKKALEYRETKEFNKRVTKITNEIYGTLLTLIKNGEKIPDETLQEYVESWVDLTRRKLKQGRYLSRVFVMETIEEFKKWLVEQKEKLEEMESETDEEE